MGRLNWTDLTGFPGGCTARDFTVSMTLRHLATVVEIAVWSTLTGLDVGGVEDGGVGVTAAIVKGSKGLGSGGRAVGDCPIKGKTEVLEGGVKRGCPRGRWGGGPGGGPGGDCPGRRGGGPGGGPGGPDLWVG